MNITITIDNPTQEVMQALAVAAAGYTEQAATAVKAQAELPDAPAQATESSDTETVVQEKPKRQRRSTAQPDELTKQPEQSEQPKQDEPVSESKPEEEQPQNDKVAVPTVVELRAKAREVGVTPEDKIAIKALLDKFGATSISEVPEEKRADFMAELSLI